MTIEAIIWDFGGVFTTSPFEAFNRYEAARGLPENVIRSINATNPFDNAWAVFERGEIDAIDFDIRFSEEARLQGHAINGADVLPLLSDDLRPAMVEALEVCKKRFKVGCITNNMAHGRGASMTSSRSAAASIAKIMAMFDVVIESSKVGIRKPDPRIYRMMCELLEVEPQNCVYLDDLGINCKPAAALGMKAIKVLQERQALEELERATGLSFK